MSQQVVFPCPNCGASQSVDSALVSTQCQFCGNTISVPEELRDKAPPAQPAGYPGMGSPTTISIGGMANIPGMANLPSMFVNMDIGKLRAMAMAARNGDTAEAARLYSENFGVGPEEAMQAAQLMSQHHHIVLGQMQFRSSPVIQMSGQPMSAPISSPTPIYNLPSPPVPGGNPGTGSKRWAGCVAVALVLLIAVLAAGVIIASALARAR